MNTAYINAPDLLLDKIAEARSVLDKQNKNTESYRFWKSVVDIMQFAYNYITDTRYVHSKNNQLESENAFLRVWAKEFQDKLQVYETIKAEMLAGTIEQTQEIVKHTINEL